MVDAVQVDAKERLQPEQQTMPITEMGRVRPASGSPIDTTAGPQMATGHLSVLH